MIRQFGLIGKKIGHSFSPQYFAQKFEEEQLQEVRYDLFPLEKIEEFPSLLERHPNLQGLNVTIPYKKAIIPYLDKLSLQAQAVGAVNTIQFRDNKLIGHNTDVWGFQQSLAQRLNRQQEEKALVLGTGGAAQAVCYALEQLQISYQLVSRTDKANCITYEEISNSVLQQYSIIINTSPLGMHPNIDTKPNLPYKGLLPSQLLFDLVYNPSVTLFLEDGKKRGCAVQNGLEMLHLQADKAWAIWNS